MSRSEKAEITTLCMVYDEDRILVQDRIDKSWPGICFPGGHVEHGESFVDAVKREVLEETGLAIEQPKLCGIKQFQTKNDERYIVVFFKTDCFSGKLKSSNEGEVFWIKREDLTNYKLANDFESMVKVMESDELSEFIYQKDETGWKVRLL
ncbi:MAG TPA: 8-oxo-dGTP diphosphatase [Lachnospiraceae bacterium]|nr:8-oxo-dGTP diphosphatase [Lachnospiraceae bacterium]